VTICIHYAKLTKRFISAFHRIRQEEAIRNAPKGSGQVSEPSSEKELMSILADRGGELGSGSGQPIIVHFYHKEFRRCDIMSTHLEVRL